MRGLRPRSVRKAVSETSTSSTDVGRRGLARRVNSLGAVSGARGRVRKVVLVQTYRVLNRDQHLSISESSPEQLGHADDAPTCGSLIDRVHADELAIEQLNRTCLR